MTLTPLLTLDPHPFFSPHPNTRGLRYLCFFDGLLLICGFAFASPSSPPALLINAALLWGPFIGYSGLTRFHVGLLALYLLYFICRVAMGVVLVCVYRIYWALGPLLVHLWLLRLIFVFLRRAAGHSDGERHLLARRGAEFPRRAVPGGEGGGGGAGAGA